MTGGTYANCINSSGQIAGFCYDADGNQYGFLQDTDATYQTFTIPDGQFPSPSQINDDGVIVGNYDDISTGNQYGFLAQVGGGSIGDFLLTASTTTIEVAQESQYAITVSIISLSGYDSDVALSISGSLPEYVTDLFDPSTVPGGSGYSSLLFTVGALAATGSTPLQIVAMGADGNNHYLAITLIVTPPGGGVNLLTFPSSHHKYLL